MLRTVGPQGSLFELLLPAGMRVLSGELAKVDALLDDGRLFVNNHAVGRRHRVVEGGTELSVK